jgi:hypothetical protein
MSKIILPIRRRNKNLIFRQIKYIIECNENFKLLQKINAAFEVVKGKGMKKIAGIEEKMYHLKRNVIL